MLHRYVVIALIALALLDLAACAKKAKEADPRECEVCISNLDKIDALVPKDKKKDKDAIETAINKHCTAKGAGSDWKPNPALTSPKDVKMCYIFEPIKKAISQPFSTGMPKAKVCKRLMKDNPEICQVKYRK
jgi:ARMET, N-terminal